MYFLRFTLIDPRPMKHIYKSITLLLACLIACWDATPAFAQEAGEGRTSHEAGILLNLSRLEGDGPAFLRQNAGDVSTNFGTTASYSRHWSPGIGIYAAQDVRLVKFLGIRMEAQASRQSSRETYTVAYDPALPSGLTGRSATVRNDYYTFSPGVIVKGGWKGFSLGVGLVANIFVYGHTQTSHSSTLADGSSSTTEESVRLDTQGQPIYQDASQVGGVVDYTNINLRNHGASPVWWAGIARASWKVLDRKWSPIVGLSWQLPLSEVQRSQNPRFSLINAYSNDMHELYEGFKLSTTALNLGWTF